MAGFALWSEGEKRNGQCQILTDLHFNLWTEYSDKETNPILDIGIKTKYSENLNKICFYLPYSINRNSFSDLGDIIRKDKTLLNSVFNEAYTIEDSEKEKQYEVKNKHEHVFTIYALDNENDIEVTQIFEGTVLSINLKNGPFENGKTYYFRLRCKDKALKNLIEKKSNNAFCESVSTENHFIDFRLNDWRSFENKSLVETINNSNLEEYCISKINFFLMTKGEIDVLSKNKKSERKLESKIWKDYVDLNSKNVIIANQWQHTAENDNPIESFNVYAKFKKQWCNIKTISWYLIILFAVNFIFSMLNEFFFGELTFHKDRLISHGVFFIIFGSISLLLKLKNR